MDDRESAGRVEDGDPMAMPTSALEVLTMTDSELSSARESAKAAILDDAQRLTRLPSNASVERFAAALRLKLAYLEAIHEERRFRRHVSRSKR